MFEENRMKKIMSAILVMALVTGSFISTGYNNELQRSGKYAVEVTTFSDEDYPFHWG